MIKLSGYRPLLWVLITLFSSSYLQGAENADDQADHEALRKLVGIYEQTIQAAKPELLKPYLADDFSGVMVTAEEVDSFSSLDAYWQKIQGLLGKGGSYRVKVNIPQPAEIVGDMAYAHGTTDDAATTSAGKEYHFTSRWTAICRKEADSWKIVRIHGSMDPISNTFVASAVKAASYSAAGIAGVIGLISGCALALLLRRRPSHRTDSLS